MLTGDVPTLAHLPPLLARLYPSSTALQANVRTVSFPGLAALVDRAAARLGTRIEPGDRVALVAENSPEWVVAFLAIARAGGVAVPLDPAAARDDLLRHADVRLVLGEQNGLSVDTLTAPGTVGRLPARLPSADDPAAILYTSGSLGAPRGVVLSHRSLMASVRSSVACLPPGGGHNALMLLPMRHVYPLTCAFGCLLSGARLTFSDSLQPARVRRVMRDAGVTLLPAVPQLVDLMIEGLRARPLLRVWLRAGRFAPRVLGAPLRALLGGLEAVIVGGAPLRESTADALNAMGVTVIHGYGLTETAGAIAFTRASWRPGDGVGPPLPGVEVRIRGGDTDAGEIEVRGDCVMCGYLHDQAATADVLHDGWLRTGDLGRLDSRGHLHLVGRSKNLIVLPSGCKVFPEALERHYAASRSVRDICVVSAHDEDGGEHAMALIVASAGATREDVLGELRRLSAGLPDAERVKRFRFVEGFPRTASGKIDRVAALRAVAAAGPAEGQPVPALARQPAE